MAAKNEEVIIYEDEAYRKLYPITYLRPTFGILCGFGNLVHRVSRILPDARVNLIARRQLEEFLKFYFPECVVNEPPENGGLFLNGRCLNLPGAILKSQGQKVFRSRGAVVGFRTDGEIALDPESGVVAQRAIAELTEQMSVDDVEVMVLEHPWDLIRYNPELLGEDFQTFGGGGVDGDVDTLAVVYGDASLLSIGPGSKVEAFCVLDLRGGPVVIGDEVTISSHSVVQGPCYIGNGSRVQSAQVRAGTSMGPSCQVSGEVECTVFQGWSNKQHLGYMGHSWIGEWVNLGAGTNNSDLKNNYQSIRVGPEDSAVDTQMLKLGCFVADHSKTGIGCLLNTGAIVGPFCSLLGGSVSPRYVPPFSWQGPNGLEEYRLDKAISTARVVMSRRSVEMSDAYERLVRNLFEQVRGGQDGTFSPAAGHKGSGR